MNDLIRKARFHTISHYLTLLHNGSQGLATVLPSACGQHHVSRSSLARFRKQAARQAASQAALHFCSPSRQPCGMATSFSTLRGVEKPVGSEIIRLRKDALVRVIDVNSVSETPEEGEVTVITSLPREV